MCIYTQYIYILKDHIYNLLKFNIFMLCAVKLMGEMYAVHQRLV